jgi:hypothetical protein
VFKIVLGSVPETTELLELQCTLLCASHRWFRLTFYISGDHI